MAVSKLRNASADPEAECVLDMSPMIDMVFLLLIFFIVNATAIIVKTDPEVDPPIAVNSKPQVNKDGRIVVNIHEDGTFTAEDFNTILKDEQMISAYIKEMRQRNETLNYESRLHLRGHKESLFKHGRTVIRCAAEQEVRQVVFGVFVREQ